MAIPTVLDKMKKVETTGGVDESPKSPEVVFLDVSLDTPIETVIASDRKGWKVTFSDEPGKFKRLSEGELNQLHRVTQAAYLVSERYHQKALDTATELRPMVSDIRQDARATDRLHVGNKNPDLYYSWKRDDEVQKAVAYEGWKASTDPKLETFRKPVGGAYTVGSKGVDELILMERPKDLHIAHLRKAVEKSDKMRGSVEHGAATGDSLVFEEGDSRFDPKGKKWSEVGKGDVVPPQ